MYFEPHECAPETARNADTSGLYMLKKAYILSLEWIRVENPITAGNNIFIIC